ncbi:MAG: PadR family transcriptional regulator, partial [Rhodobacteraceae bacterium]|nr:PadR family transcriptional regulator [Paracoccaceae bacterium]
MSHPPSDEIAIDEVDPRATDALRCLNAYYDELARRFPGGFDVTRSRDPEAADMTAPRGVFLVARSVDRPVACAGLKGQGRWGEVKR